MKTKLLIATTLALLTFGALASAPASAFHGAFWRGFGTATDPDGLTFDVEFFWGGQDAIIACGGGGCQGSGDGHMALRDATGLNVLRIPYTGIEDVREVIFVNDPAFCPSQVNWPDPLEVTPNYVLTYGSGTLTGIQRNCLSTGINRNDFTGNYLDFELVIHAEGPFGVAHG